MFVSTPKLIEHNVSISVTAYVADVGIIILTGISRTVFTGIKKVLWNPHINMKTWHTRRKSHAGFHFFVQEHPYIRTRDQHFFNKIFEQHKTTDRQRSKVMYNQCFIYRLSKEAHEIPGHITWFRLNRFSFLRTKLANFKSVFIITAISLKFRIIGLSIMHQKQFIHSWPSPAHR